MRANTAQPTPGGSTPSPSRDDQRVVIHGVPWRSYLAIRDLLDSPGLRMTYDKGTLELTTPSPVHELRKKSLARLLEVFALERDVRLIGYGSTTFRREAGERGLEPDECYVLGGALREVPDIALEVVVTSGGMNKLPIYAGLGVAELWMFEDDAFQLHALRGGQYESIPRSELVPGLDFVVLARFASRDDQHDAVVEFRDWLRGS